MTAVKEAVTSAKHQLAHHCLSYAAVCGRGGADGRQENLATVYPWGVCTAADTGLCCASASGAAVASAGEDWAHRPAIQIVPDLDDTGRLVAVSLDTRRVLHVGVDERGVALLHFPAYCLVELEAAAAPRRQGRPVRSAGLCTGTVRQRASGRRHCDRVRAMRATQPRHSRAVLGRAACESTPPRTAEQGAHRARTADRRLSSETLRRGSCGQRSSPGYSPGPSPPRGAPPCHWAAPPAWAREVWRAAGGAPPW